MKDNPDQYVIYQQEVLNNIDDYEIVFRKRGTEGDEITVPLTPEKLEWLIEHKNTHDPE